MYPAVCCGLTKIRISCICVGFGSIYINLKVGGKEYKISLNKFLYLVFSICFWRNLLDWYLQEM